MTETERDRQGYRISTNPTAMNIDAVHGYLSRSYWANGISLDVVARSIHESMCFGLFKEDLQVGFARVVTDRATFAFLCDVYVLEEHRGRGLAKWLIETVVAHPDLLQVKRFVLATRDAHGLYERFGFRPLARPDIFMEIIRSGLQTSDIQVGEPAG